MGYTSMGLTPSASAKARARRQADALAELAVDEAEKRLVLDWDAPLRHPTFYKAVYRPAVLRATLGGRDGATARIEVPRSPTHVREPLRRSGDQAREAQRADGTRQRTDDAGRLR